MNSDDERLHKRLVKCRDQVLTAWACASLLRPDLNPQGKQKLAQRILRVAESEDHSLGTTPVQAQEIVLGQIQCTSTNCPMLIFAEPLSRKLNMFFGEDR
jgi:hypothetical protein